MRRAGGSREKPSRKRCTRPPSWSTATISAGACAGVDLGLRSSASCPGVGVVACEQDHAADEGMAQQLALLGGDLSVRPRGRSSGARLMRGMLPRAQHPCSAAPAIPRARCGETCRRPLPLRASCRARAPARPGPAPGSPDGRKYTTPAAGASRASVPSTSRAPVRGGSSSTWCSGPAARGIRRAARQGWRCGSAAFADAVALRVAARPLDEPRLALHAHHLPRVRASASVKFPRPQKRSSTRAARDRARAALPPGRPAPHSPRRSPGEIRRQEFECEAEA